MVTKHIKTKKKKFSLSSNQEKMQMKIEMNTFHPTVWQHMKFDNIGLAKNFVWVFP